MSLTLSGRTHDFQLVPEGPYLARCFGLVELGTQTSRHGSQSRKVAIGWELSHALPINHIPFVHWQYYTLSLNPQSVLNTLLESWRGRKFNAEERDEFQLENMLDTPCCLKIRHRSHAENAVVFAVVDTIAPLPNSVICPPLHHDVIHFDLDYYTEADYHAMPEFIRKRITIKKSDV